MHKTRRRMADAIKERPPRGVLSAMIFLAINKQILTLCHLAAAGRLHIRFGRAGTELDAARVIDRVTGALGGGNGAARGAAAGAGAGGAKGHPAAAKISSAMTCARRGKQWRRLSTEGLPRGTTGTVSSASDCRTR